MLAIDQVNTNRQNFLLTGTIKILDESMSAWKPRVSEKGDLPHLTKVDRKPRDIGTEFKTVACVLLGVMLYLEIQRGSKGMGNMLYANEMQQTAACSKRLVHGSTQSWLDGRSELYLGDAWFGNLNTLRAIAAVDHDGIGTVQHKVIFVIKTGKRLFPKDALASILKDQPAGTSAVFKTTDPVIKREILAIGWNYNQSNTLFFLATADAGSTEPGTPYKIRFPDWFGNVTFREVPRPKILNTYFEGANMIDRHNHYRQGVLSLEEKWVTTNGHFRILTTLIGMNVTDTFLLAKHHDMLGPLKKRGINGKDVTL